MIASDSTLLAEARAALPALRRHATHPAGDEGVKAVIGRRFVTYPQGARSDGEWVAWWADYTDALSDLPRGALEAAMKAWVARPESKFLPMPGELRALARSTVNAAQVAYDRAYEASIEANSPTDSWAARRADPLSVTERHDPAAVKAMLADYLGKVAASRPAPKPGRPTHGALAEGRHITQAMIDLLAKRKLDDEPQQHAMGVGR